MREAQRHHEDPVAAILDEGHGKLLFRGKVVDVARRTTEGFLRGRALIEGLDEDRGSRLEIAFQNEWIVAWRDEAPVAMSPDLICVLDTVSGEAFGTETIGYGRRVSVVVLPAPPVFLTPKGLDHVGPRAFGYDLDFRSVFDESAMRRCGGSASMSAAPTPTPFCSRTGGWCRPSRLRPRRMSPAGILTALGGAGAPSRDRAQAIDGVVIGTTHFVNAVVQRRDLARVAAVRIGLPASAVTAALLSTGPIPRDLLSRQRKGHTKSRTFVLDTTASRIIKCSRNRLLLRFPMSQPISSIGNI